MAVGWARETVDAQDVHEMVHVVVARLRSFVAQTDPDADALATRQSFERMVVGLIERSRARGVFPDTVDPDFTEVWHRFVEDNAEHERRQARRLERRGYERGRFEALEAMADGLLDPRAQPAYLGDNPVAASGRAEPAPSDTRQDALRSLIARRDETPRRRPDLLAPGSLPVGDEHAPCAFALEEGDLADIGTLAISADSHDRHIAPVERSPARRSDRDPPAEDVVSAPEARSSGIATADSDARGDGKTPSRGTDVDDLREMFDIDADPLVPHSKPVLLSVALEAFLAEDEKRKSDGRAAANVAPVVRFMIDLIGDVRLDKLTEGQRRRVDQALVDIPYPGGFRGCKKMSLYERYRYAEKKGWTKLRRATITTVKDRYHSGLHRFFDWLKEKRLLVGDRPTFSHVTEELYTPLPRDAFEDDELIALISLPLFTGCKSRARIWTPGDLLCQTGLYWAFLILILTGMRPGEVAQVEVDQVKTDGEFFYFDLRPFDPRQGRVPIGDALRLKSTSSARVVPIHPLLIDLGLIEHMLAMKARGEVRLLPDLQPYVKPNGEIRWSQAIVKAWQYLRRSEKLGISRQDLTLYGTRHLVAAWLDKMRIAERSRDRILGHVSGDAKARYGRKGLDPDEARIIAELEPGVVARMREILMGALARVASGELRLVTAPRPVPRSRSEARVRAEKRTASTTAARKRPRRR